MDNPLVNIDGESIDRTVTEMYKTMIKSIKTFADIPAVKSVAVEIKRQIEEFKPYIPLIQAIRSPGMRQRHWEQFQSETGKYIIYFIKNKKTQGYCMMVKIYLIYNFERSTITPI